MAKEVLSVWLIASLFKLLVWPAYRSTDFSVHAHWLAITSRLPTKEWYLEESSRWTLDYPPVFAWFEHALARFAHPPHDLLTTSDEPFDCFRETTATVECFSNQAVLWHRATVVLSEMLVLGTAVALYTKTWPRDGDNAELRASPQKRIAAVCLVAFDPNLLLVDNIHFQYNGILLGVLLLSITCLRMEHDMLGAMLFAVLLCFKHIFIYAAPLYFVYLFKRSILYTPELNIPYFLGRMMGLGSIVLAVFFCSVYSVCELDLPCMKHMASRMFPVGERGLLHAYWAPNFWALYAGLDKFLKFAFYGQDTMSRSTTALGLVTGHVDFDILPSVPVYETIFLSLLGMAPALYTVWVCPRPQIFLHAYVVCVLSFFIFGYHVHEKALLMASVPLALTALDSAYDARAYFSLSAVTFVALSPLLFVMEMTVVKLLLGSTFAVFACIVLDGFHLESKKHRRIAHRGLTHSLFRQSLFRSTYLCGLVMVWLVYESGMITAYRQRLEFLPLMLVSVYCSVGVIGCWIELYFMLLRKQSAIESY